MRVAEKRTSLRLDGLSGSAYQRGGIMNAGLVGGRIVPDEVAIDAAAVAGGNDCMLPEPVIPLMGLENTSSDVSEAPHAKDVRAELST